jgi:hypothetical protein
MLNHYIRRFHQFPATPAQTSYLETYSSDSADNVRLLSRVFNLLTNFNGPEIFDNADDLPVFSGVAQVYQYEDKMFSLDMTGNILYIGPGVAVIRDVVTDFTETTELDVHLMIVGSILHLSINHIHHQWMDLQMIIYMLYYLYIKLSYQMTLFKCV